jgi:plasmid stabilization system protein ParE
VTQVIIAPEADADIRDAVNWYAERDPILPARFIAELGHIFERVGENPMQFPLVEQSVHRALLAKFPYSVYFTTEHADTAMVLAVAHPPTATSRSLEATLDGPPN